MPKRTGTEDLLTVHDPREDAPADSPETHDEGTEAAVPAERREPVEVVVGTDVRVDEPEQGGQEALREARNAKSLEQAPPPEDEAPQPELPSGSFDSEAFRAANSGARDAFAQVVRRPGHIFRDHGGRYVNIFDIEEVYDVEPGTIIPDGLFLFPVNYLVREESRKERLRG